MNSIRSKIQFAIVISIVVVGVSALGLLFVNQKNALVSRKTVETMTAENSIISLSSELVATYNDVVKNPGNEQFVKKYQAIHSEIDTVIASLKNTVISQESRILLRGVESTVNRVVNECERGLHELDQADYTSTSDHFVEASKYNEYVRDNIRTLLQKELEYLASTQAQSQKTYITGVVGSLAIFGLIIVIMIFVSRSFARQMTDPIVSLSIFAKKIASGDLAAQYVASKKIRQDEIGSLTSSIHVMVEKLLETMNLISSEKRNVELKVEERTKELSDEKSKLLASISALPRAFLIIDADNRIVTHNDKLESIFGSQTQDWSVAMIDQLLGGSFALQDKIQEVFRDKKVFDIPEFQYGAKFLRFYLAPVISSDKELIGVVVTIKDATEARVLARSKDEFFSIASHELRTPLTAIRGNTSMMLDYYSESFRDPELKQMLDDTHNASVRLIGIVNDFLDMSRLEQGKMQYTITSFSIEEIVQKVVKDLSENAKKKGVELTLHGEKGLLVRADAGKVEQVLFNIVGNSLKFTDHGSVSINIVHKDNQVGIEVIDTGLGISLANQGILFHKFQQAGSSTITRDGAKGTGLGLYISRLMAEGMGGKLELVKSEEGKGSTFLISLLAA